MYPQIPWERVADPEGSAEHILGTTDAEGLFTKITFLRRSCLNVGPGIKCPVYCAKGW
jgi:hypothetical protein